MLKCVKLFANDQRVFIAWHPQTDGQTEHADRTFKDRLRPAQNDWNVGSCLAVSLLQAVHRTLC